MNLDQVQRDIRGTDAEQVMLLAHAEGGTVMPSQYKKELGARLLLSLPSDAVSRGYTYVCIR